MPEKSGASTRCEAEGRTSGVMARPGG